ncbi:hypothetical protein [Alkalinema sp. FACHB-956]|uniref:hypothetical protein n=1 Tax=Alkalinema sp. FACHB-956 TaxID=2692768 RepID=UPI001689172F|nr:hypothetical protein [Alkalinema sp. FACHB-956]MBD2327364.1 hypothetical protein [Alkalinema sp. FACHB-956]
MKLWKWPKDFNVLQADWASWRQQQDEQQIQELDRLIRSQIADLDRWVDNRFPLSNQLLSNPPLSNQSPLS